MKTKYWILILAAALAVSLLCTVPFLLTPAAAERAEVYSQGTLLYSLDLAVDQTVTVSTPDGGSNTVTVRDGKIAVTAANCPDHYCMDRGYCSGGTQIVCLPNRLVIQFVGEQEVDALAG